MPEIFSAIIAILTLDEVKQMLLHWGLLLLTALWFATTKGRGFLKKVDRINSIAEAELTANGGSSLVDVVKRLDGENKSMLANIEAVREELKELHEADVETHTRLEDRMIHSDEHINDRINEVHRHLEDRLDELNTTIVNFLVSLKTPDKSR